MNMKINKPEPRPPEKNKCKINYKVNKYNYMLFYIM